MEVSTVQVASGLVVFLNLGLAFVVAVRLLRLWSRRGSVPERSLGTYFLASAFLGALPQIIAYGSLSDEAWSLSDFQMRLLLGMAIFGMAVGAAGVYIFTWRTFRAQQLWAGVAVGIGLSALALGFALEAIHERFALVVIPGLGHWLGWAGRTLPMLWVSIESFRYYTMLRRRLRLGLADPVLTNRFLLWAIWAAAVFLNLAADLLARVAYVVAVGTTSGEVIAESAAPIVMVTISITMVLGAISAVTLFLTFFATDGYRRWLEARSASRVD
jgi:hypothetical protein